MPTLAARAAISRLQNVRAVPATYTPAAPLVAVADAVPDFGPADQPPSPTPTLIPTITPTPGPYDHLTIPFLRARPYGVSGPLEIVETMGRTATFTRYLFRYPSDGLNVYGFMNVPHGEGAFPVVVALHGYVELEEYETLDYTARYADSLAANGYLVLHPNYRNHPPSDNGPNAFRVGYAVDVLNLMALAQQQAGRPGPLEKAQSGPVHLWGHSMGGGIALRVLTVSPNVRSAVLYGSMSGDEYQNYERIREWSEGERGAFELETRPEVMQLIAPGYHLASITAPVSIHHGRADAIIPLSWSQLLCEELRALGKDVTCFIYPDQPHNFVGDGDRLFRERVLDFFRRQE